MPKPKTKKIAPLTPDMLAVLSRMQAGENVFYSTSALSDRYWIEEGPYIRRPTIKGLTGRGLAEHKYAFPIGKFVLTQKGREYVPDQPAPATDTTEPQ